MNDVSTYRIGYTLSVIHPYFEGVTLPCEVYPSGDTQKVFQREQWLFKKRKPGEWVILMPQEGAIPPENYSLLFFIHPADPLFYYVSVREDEPSVLPGVWSVIHLSYPFLPETMRYTISVKEVFWEYVFFLTPHLSGNDFLVREKQGRIAFQPIIKTQWMDGKEVYIVRTDTKIKLACSYPYRIEAEYVTRGGEKQTETLPAPSPTRLSVGGQEDTITSYIYL